MSVHAEEQGYVAFPKDVTQDGLVVSRLEIVMEQGFRFFVFEQVERNGSNPLGIDEDIGMAIDVLQFFGGLNHLFEVGCHGIGYIHRKGRVKWLTFVLRVMDRKRKSIRTQADG